MMMVVGVIMAIIAGCALPIHMLLFGRVINQFVYYQIAVDDVIPIITVNFDTLNSNSCNISLSCDQYVGRVVDGTLLTIFNTSCAEGTNFTLIDLGEAHFCSNEGSDVFDNVLEFVCDPEDTFYDEITLFSIYYVGLATAVLISMFVAFLFWNLSGYRQTLRMRNAFFASILKQDIGWFDVTASAQLSTRLAE